MAERISICPGLGLREMYHKPHIKKSDNQLLTATIKKQLCKLSSGLAGNSFIAECHRSNLHNQVCHKRELLTTVKGNIDTPVGVFTDQN